MWYNIADVVVFILADQIDQYLAPIATLQIFFVSRTGTKSVDAIDNGEVSEKLALNEYHTLQRNRDIRT